MPSKQSQTGSLHGIDLEYNSLRAEILKRIELRQQIISITLTLAGLILSFGLTNDTVALIYPPLAAFLSLGWAQNDFRIRDLATYIREHLEKGGTGLGYETYIQKNRPKDKRMSAWRVVVVSHNGIFIFTQLMAIGISLLKNPTFSFSPLEWTLLGVDLVSMIVVIFIASLSGR